MPTTTIDYGSSFDDSINYVFGNGNNAEVISLIESLPETSDDGIIAGFRSGSRARIVLTNLVGNDPKSHRRQLKKIASKRPEIKKPVIKFTVNLSPQDDLKSSETLKLINYFLGSMNLKNCPYVVVEHRDKNHRHFHIIVSRVDFDGKLVDTSFDRLKSRTWAREMETLFKLQPTQQRAGRKGLTIAQQEKYKLSGILPAHARLQNIINSAVEKTATDFIDILHSENVHPRFKFDAKNPEKIIGISFRYDERNYSGGSLGADYCWGSLQKRGLSYEQLRDNNFLRDINSNSVSFEKNKNGNDSSGNQLNFSQKDTVVDDKSVANKTVPIGTKSVTQNSNSNDQIPALEPKDKDVLKDDQSKVKSSIYTEISTDLNSFLNPNSLTNFNTQTEHTKTIESVKREFFKQTQTNTSGEKIDYSKDSVKAEDISSHKPLSVQNSNDVRRDSAIKIDVKNIAEKNDITTSLNNQNIAPDKTSRKNSVESFARGFARVCHKHDMTKADKLLAKGEHYHPASLEELNTFFENKTKVAPSENELKEFKQLQSKNNKTIRDPYCQMESIMLQFFNSDLVTQKEIIKQQISEYRLDLSSNSKLDLVSAVSVVSEEVSEKELLNEPVFDANKKIDSGIAGLQSALPNQALQSEADKSNNSFSPISFEPKNNREKSKINSQISQINDDQIHDPTISSTIIIAPSDNNCKLNIKDADSSLAKTTLNSQKLNPAEQDEKSNDQQLAQTKPEIVNPVLSNEIVSEPGKNNEDSSEAVTNKKVDSPKVLSPYSAENSLPDRKEIIVNSPELKDSNFDRKPINAKESRKIEVLDSSTDLEKIKAEQLEAERLANYLKAESIKAKRLQARREDYLTIEKELKREISNQRADEIYNTSKYASTIAEYKIKTTQNITMSQRGELHVQTYRQIYNTYWSETKKVRESKREFIIQQAIQNEIKYYEVSDKRSSESLKVSDINKMSTAQKTDIVIKQFQLSYMESLSAEAEKSTSLSRQQLRVLEFSSAKNDNYRPFDETLEYVKKIAKTQKSDTPELRSQLDADVWIHSNAPEIVSQLICENQLDQFMLDQNKLLQQMCEIQAMELFTAIKQQSEELLIDMSQRAHQILEQSMIQKSIEAFDTVSPQLPLITGLGKNNNQQLTSSNEHISELDELYTKIVKGDEKTSRQSSLQIIDKANSEALMEKRMQDAKDFTESKNDAAQVPKMLIPPGYE